MLQRPLFIVSIALVSLLLGGAAHGLDWVRAAADADTVDVLTTDEDGETRDTVIWVAVVDGAAYIRTSGRSAWGDDIERNPDIALRVGDTEHPVRAELIADREQRDRIEATFREKYGFTDAALDWMRGGDSRRIMRLHPR